MDLDNSTTERTSNGRVILDPSPVFKKMQTTDYLQPGQANSEDSEKRIPATTNKYVESSSSSYPAMPNTRRTVEPVQVESRIPSTRVNIGNSIDALNGNPPTMASYIADQKRHVLSSRSKSSQPPPPQQQQQKIISPVTTSRYSGRGKQGISSPKSSISGSVQRQSLIQDPVEYAAITTHPSSKYAGSSEITSNIEAMSGLRPVSKASAVVDSHDAIWSELDVMEDIDRISEQVSTAGNFFGSKHRKALDSLHKSQLELLSTMAKGEDIIDQMFNESKLWEINDTDISIETFEDGGFFSVGHFNKVQNTVDSVMESLDIVVDTMKVLESESRDFWNDTDD
ncbi:hypothetical protein V1511DRAFT_504883 [Dipodascopsis uninucleata]